MSLDPHCRTSVHGFTSLNLGFLLYKMRIITRTYQGWIRDSADRTNAIIHLLARITSAVATSAEMSWLQARRTGTGCGVGAERAQQCGEGDLGPSFSTPLHAVSTVHLPHTLRCANITIIKHEECETAYPGNVTDTMVCASVREEGKDSCQVRGQGLGLQPHPHSRLLPQCLFVYTRNLIPNPDSVSPCDPNSTSTPSSHS